MSALIQDLRFAIRTLCRNRGFTAVALLMLALGIGANTAIFSVIDVTLLRPPRFAHLDRLVNVFDTNRQGPGGGAAQRISPSPGNFLDWRKQVHSFDHMAAWRNWYYSLAGPEGRDGAPESVRGVRVSPSFFSMLGVEPALGRTFDSGEEAPGHDHVAVLANSLWTRRFGGDRSIIGQTVRVDGSPFTVIGVLPPDYCFLRCDLELWMPLAFDNASQSREDHSVQVYASIAPGVSLARAQSDLDAVAHRLEQSFPASNAGWGAAIVPLYPGPFIQGMRSALMMLAAAVAFVLLIACANFANLLLARATVRQKEMAIRAAIGAGRLRLIRQTITESVAITTMGGALGLLVANAALRLMIPLLPNIPTYRAVVPVIDGRSLGFTILVAFATGIIFGVFPALRTTRADYLRSAASPAGALRAGRFLLASQLTLSIVLLAGAAILIESLWRLQSVNPGFRTDHLLSMQVWLPKAKYPQRSSLDEFAESAIRRLDALPGVVGAGAVNVRPFLGWGVGARIEIHGAAAQAAGSRPPVVEYRIVTPDYLRMLGVRFLEGRDLAPGDGPTSAGAVVINQAMARRFWPGESAIGKQIRPLFHKASAPWDVEPDPLERWLTVVGIVAGTKEYVLSQPDQPEMYLCYGQFPSSYLFFVLRTSPPPTTMAPAVRREILAIDRDQPVSDIRTMDAAIEETVAQPRLNASLLTVFSLLAVVLSAGGVYGVMSYTVSQRTHEIAIRMALGARPADVERMVFREVSVVAVASSAAGSLASAWLTRSLGSLIFGTRPAGFPILCGACVLLLAVAFAACFVPARRAALVDPMPALRS